MRALGRYITDYCDSIQAFLDTWYGTLAAQPVKNATVHGAMAGNLPPALLYVLGNITVAMGAGINYPLASYIFSTYVVNNIKHNVLSSVPDKFGYLLQLLEAGQPCASPAADFIKKAVEEFNIREGPYRIPWISYGEDFLGLMGAPGADGSISPIPYGLTVNGVPMGGETIYIYASVDVEVDDAGTVTVSIEYDEDGQLDPRDVIDNLIDPDPDYDPDELEDWEWVFPKASDGPTQMKDGDTIFYETTPMEGPIPGYEVTIIIGVSLVSVIGLIYVIMRKRKK